MPKDPGEPACVSLRFVEISAVLMELSAAGLIARERHVVPEALQHGDGRSRRLGEERVAQTRDEEPDAHSLVHRAEPPSSNQPTWSGVKRIPLADSASSRCAWERVPMSASTCGG